MPTVIVGVANIPVNNELLIVSTEIPYHGFTIIQEGYVSGYYAQDEFGFVITSCRLL